MYGKVAIFLAGSGSGQYVNVLSRGEVQDSDIPLPLPSDVRIEAPTCYCGSHALQDPDLSPMALVKEFCAGLCGKAVGMSDRYSSCRGYPSTRSKKL